MKIDLNWFIKGLDGKPIVNAHAGQTLAQAISLSNKGNSIKLHDWALKLWNETPLQVDEMDADALIALIENSEMLTILAKAPLIEYIKKAKEKADKK